MALKTVPTADVPTLDHVHESPIVAAAPLTSTTSMVAATAPATMLTEFVVVGHRGSGMNVVAPADRRLRAVKENSLLSFNRAGGFPIRFVEFDVQVTKDGCPIIFHDDLILTEEAGGGISEKLIKDLTLEEFLSYGPQKGSEKVGKTLLRRSKDGKVLKWSVEEDDSLCTLQEAFQKVAAHLGFNIELKFDDFAVYRDEELIHSLQAVLKVVTEHANGRPVFFSTFQPDAARLVRRLQCDYAVFFLTEGGTETYDDIRRNSMDEAIKLCLECGLQGIVSDVRGVFRNPAAVPRIKESNLCLLTYGQLNNVPEAVYMQHLMGINGVIEDLVEEITEAVSDLIKPAAEAAAMNAGSGDGTTSRCGMEVVDDDRQCTRWSSTKPNFSQRELSFLLRLIPELVQG